MNAVTRKLKSRSGISMAIALVFFLLCAMVGAVVLSDASASAASTARERQLYRETMALTSAADLLSRDIQAMTFTGSYTRKETVTTTVVLNQPTKVKTSEEKKLAEQKLEGSKLFSMKKQGEVYSDPLDLTTRYAMNQQLAGSAAAPSPQDITFQAVEAQHIPEVKGTVTVEADYTLSVELQCGKNSLFMSFPPHVDTKTEIGLPETKYPNTTDVEKSTTSTYSTILTWEQPLMREGGGDDA